ncbi:60S ribosomal protein L18a-like protein [Chenopodium quinoa]|uniref:60S ribosomal protein L18a-like protein n=1 Tax=Chenopodium quinoa TaxID=63459 RepID=UPI000B76D42B|nr:60S ribosomal protein L18a-like protein [Chenopodium quinoa]
MTEKDRKGTTSTSGATAPPDPSPPLVQPEQQPYYGTFQGVACFTQPPPQPVIGFPQPAPPPGATILSNYYARGYQTVPGYVIAEGRPLREPRLPCCGIGIGWMLFISGFLFAALPWYVGAMILLCGRVDYREKPGLVACMVASILSVIAIVFGVTNGDDFW